MKGIVNTAAVAVIAALCLTLASCGDKGGGGAEGVTATEGLSGSEGITAEEGIAALESAGAEEAAANDPEGAALLGKPAYGGEAVFSINMPKTLNPLKNGDKSVDMALSLIFEPLIVTDNSGKPVANPAVAESFTMSDDALSAIIVIKEDAGWHDGSPVTAQDVKYTVDVLRLAEGTPYDGKAENILACEAVNDKAVKFTFAQVYSCQAYDLDFPILPRHIYEKKGDGDPAQMSPVGNGAYKFSSYNVTDGLTLTVNGGLAGKKPYIETVRFLTARDEQARRDMFDAGETDALFEFLADGGKYKSSDKYRTISYTTNYFDFLGFNCGRFTTAGQRAALAGAVPLERIFAQAYIGGIEEAAAPIRADSRLYKAGSGARRYDLEAAGAGYTGKKNIELLINEENPERERAAGMIKDSFAEIGVTAQIVKLPFDEYSARINALNYDIFIGGITAPNTPLFDYLLSGENMFGYRSAPMDLLLSNIFNAAADYKLVDACADLQDYIAEELPFYGFGFRGSVFAVSSRIGGASAPTAYNRFGAFGEWYIAVQ